MEAMLTSDQEFQLKRQRAQRNLMWLGIVSIIMIFAGLTSAYIVRRGAGNWFQITLPDVFKISTAVIILSSVTMNFSLWSFRRNKVRAGSLFLGATLVLGLAFAWFQFEGWRLLTEGGVYLVHQKGQTSLVSGSFIYMLSGLHLAHLAGGIIALLFILIRSFFGAYGANNVHGIRVVSIYWHFLDLLWIYLFVFLTIYK